ncbi:BON domain-containing protein [Sedimenticola sp.]|uniref:BON domain-containing protein n=1 Tax=Sedimenticola sp. TaxID=1940285 RepID=UPI003D11EBB8
MSKRATQLLGLTGFVLILLLALYNGTHKIEQDLTLRGETLVSEKQLPWVNIEVEGRNLRLRGEAPSEKAAGQAVELLAALDGVNQVIDSFTIVPTNQHTTDKPTSDSPWTSTVKAR